MTKKELIEFAKKIENLHDDVEIFVYVKPWAINSEYYTERFELFSGFDSIPNKEY